MRNRERGQAGEWGWGGDKGMEKGLESESELTGKLQTKSGDDFS